MSSKKVKKSTPLRSEPKFTGIGTLPKSAIVLLARMALEQVDKELAEKAKASAAQH